MDDFINKLDKISDRNLLKKAIESGRKKLGRLKGNGRLDFALRLSSWAALNHSRKLAEDLIDGVLDLARETSTEEAAIVLGQKAYFNFTNAQISEAADYADIALIKSRDIGSNKAETKALIIKGYLCDIRKEHKKTSAWYTMALAKCTKTQKPGLLLDLGTSLSKQGEYMQAWSLINKAISLSTELAVDPSTENVEKKRLKRILAKGYSRSGPVLEGIGDFDAAIRAYNEAESLCIENRFFHELYKTYSRKMKLLVIIKDFDGAESTLKKAEAVFNENSDMEPRGQLYINHDRARLYKDSKRYQMAFDKYKEILFNDLGDGLKKPERLNYLMDHQADIFSEILLGVAECLKADGKISDSEQIYREETQFSELKEQTGIYKEIDRIYKLDIQKKNIRKIFSRIFFHEPDTVEYKNILAKYDPEEEKTIFRVGKKEIKRSKRYFLVFKCLVQNAGKCVSGRMLDQFVIKEGESINEYDSGLRAYVWRLKKDIKLAQFIDNCSGSDGKGWKLRKP